MHFIQNIKAHESVEYVLAAYSQVNVIGIIVVAVNVLLVVGAMVLLMLAKRRRKKQQDAENESDN